MAQERCRNAFSKSFSQNKLKERGWYIELAYQPSLHVLDPDIDSSFTLFRSLVHFGVGQTSAKRFEWGLSLNFYKNDVTDFVGFNYEDPFFSSSHIEVGFHFWFALSPSENLGLEAQTLLNLIQVKPDNYQIHIPVLELGLRWYHPFSRNFKCFVAPGIKANPNYLIGSEVSLLTYNYGLKIDLGLRYVFR